MGHDNRGQETKPDPLRKALDAIDELRRRLPAGYNGEARIRLLFSGGGVTKTYLETEELLK